MRHLWNTERDASDLRPYLVPALKIFKPEVKNIFARAIEKYLGKPK